MLKKTEFVGRGVSGRRELTKVWHISLSVGVAPTISGLRKRYSFICGRRAKNKERQVTG